MLQINGKTFMNLQEAVQWLLDNNALPFQSSANYVANTEIGMGTIINPSPAKVRIGSLIFFADSKVSTVIGLTENGFMVSDQYNDLVDDVVYVSNVALNASGHLIVTLSNGDTIDAGLIKQVSGFSIDASQHLIASYNDGSTTDLGAIFQGNVSISGDLNVAGAISASSVSGNSIVENMAGYSYYKYSKQYFTVNTIYAGAVKNGNKLTVALFFEVTREDASGSNLTDLCQVNIPSAVADKLIPFTISGINNSLSSFTCYAYAGITTKVELNALIQKSTNALIFNFYGTGNLTVGTKYLLRVEQTFLLSDSLAS